jgi:hypothetical protein
MYSSLPEKPKCVPAVDYKSQFPNLGLSLSFGPPMLIGNHSELPEPLTLQRTFNPALREDEWFAVSISKFV